MSIIFVKTCLYCNTRFQADGSDYCSSDCEDATIEKQKRIKRALKRSAKTLRRKLRKGKPFQHPVHRILTTDCRTVKKEPENYSNYQDYLLSPRWSIIRCRILGKCHYRCQKPGCHDKANQVHHKRYKSWGAEKEKDLIALCRKHHREAHGIEFKE